MRPSTTAAAEDVGFLNVFAEPWAHVVIDGKRVGTTPLAKVVVAVGMHKVLFENPQARTVERMVMVSAGQTQLVDVDMELVQK